jgi:predicted dehydrogenase
MGHIGILNRLIQPGKKWILRHVLFHLIIYVAGRHEGHHQDCWQCFHIDVEYSKKYGANLAHWIEPETRLICYTAFHTFMENRNIMENLNRRSFVKKSSVISAGSLVGLPLLGKSVNGTGANSQIRVAVIGIRSRGKDHYRALSKVPGVTVTTLCDIDERLFPEAVAEVEAITGHRPGVELEYRKVLENKDIDAVSIATPNHWHALQTIWACQAGKDVYVEKPVSHTVTESRKMVEAARRYNRIVQTGTQARSHSAVKQAMKFIHEGGLGEIYMARGLCLKPRGSIGKVEDGPVPGGVDWDRFLGPAPYRAFNMNRFHYKWHWFWDTGNGDLGNQGIHQADIGRWALQQQSHPIRIQSTGGYYVWDSDQETPNIQHIEFEYSDGRILQFEVRGLGTNDESGVRIGNLLYGSKGWMKMHNEDEGIGEATFSQVQIQPSGYSSYREEPGPEFSAGNPDAPSSVVTHFSNFIDCMRSRNQKDLHADILEGHLSSSLCHLGNISCRLKRSLEFDPVNEVFVGDSEADLYLTKTYRAPYLLPDTV